MRSAIYFPKLINTLTPRCTNILELRKYTLNAVMQVTSDMNQVVWDPFQIFHCPTEFKYAVVILNRPIHWKYNILCEIWQKGIIFSLPKFYFRTSDKAIDYQVARKDLYRSTYLAQVTVTVDGGTQRWLKYLRDEGIDISSEQHMEYVPDLITGDMDSCSPVIIDKFRNLHSIIVETPDQNETDFTKALRQLKLYTKTKNVELNGIFVFAETSGRFDHLLANVNTLYKTEDLVGKIQVIQVASNSLTWLLKPGYHRIAIPEILVQLSCWCGLLPIGSPVNCITTTGLKWNLVNARIQFGGMVSTSNTYSNCSEVTIHTDSPVVWTMGIEPLKKIASSYMKTTAQKRNGFFSSVHVTALPEPIYLHKFLFHLFWIIFIYLSTVGIVLV